MNRFEEHITIAEGRTSEIGSFSCAHGETCGHCKVQVSEKLSSMLTVTLPLKVASVATVLFRIPR
jgi:hypothetical protein